jgi:hypothetical protein
MAPKRGMIPDELEPRIKAGLADLVAEMGENKTLALLIKHFGEATVRAALNELFATAQPTPQPTTPSPVSWRDRLSRPFFLMDGPAYYWPALNDSAVRAWLALVADAGLDGVDLELGGAFIVREYNGTSSKGLDLRPIYAVNFSRLATWLAEARRIDLLVSVKCINSNQRAAAGMPMDWWRWVGQNLASMGSQNVLAMPMNESDDRTPSTVGSAIADGLIAGGFPRGQMIDWLLPGKSGLTERHPKSTADVLRGDRSLLQITDNGTMIKALYGASWTKGGTPNLDAISGYVGAVRASGSSGGLYSFRRDPDVDGLQAAGKAWRGAGAPASGGSTDSQGDELPAGVKWLHADVSQWPITSDLEVRFSASSIVLDQDLTDRLSPGDSPDGPMVGNPWVVAQVDRQWFAATWEWLKRGQTSKSKAAVAGDHCKASPLSGAWRPKSGEVVYIAVSGLARSKTRNASERTPFVRVVWP